MDKIVLSDKFEKPCHGGQNRICRKDGWSLSYNDSVINNDNAPELAIVKDDVYAIAYYTNPADYENIEKYEDAIALMESQIKDEKSPVRIGFWNSYEFNF